MARTKFVHLHTHSDYSLLDGASQIEALVVRAAKYGMHALAITDHGNMFGAVELLSHAREQGIKPIIGCETYIAPGSRQDRTANTELPESSFHLTLLAETTQGYYNLVRLVSLGYLEGFYYRPRIDKELLAQYHQGIIGMSACLKGEVNYYLNQGDETKAEVAAGELRDIFGKDNFFLEVMRIGLPECGKVEAGVKRLSGKLGIPIVATNDSHYLDKDDFEAHEILLCLQTGKTLKDKARMKFGSRDLYFKSGAEMAEVFADQPEWLNRTLTIAERCDVNLFAQNSAFALPQFPLPKGYVTDSAYLQALAEDGLKRRMPHASPEAAQRLQYELSVINQMGFAGYFLIVKDIVDFARKQGIRVGPGRGSAVASLVLYALGITDIDPMRYGLVFERFLTPERVSLPDIDVDFIDTRRGEIIDYIRQRYGKDCVAQIITFGTIGARAGIHDVFRVMGLPIAEGDRISKMIPSGVKLSQAEKMSREFKQAVNVKPEYRKACEIACRLEGGARHASVHASGVVITPRPLIESVPLCKSKVESDDICTQYDKNALEILGLLKMDVLGLRTLTVVEQTLALLQKQGISLDLTEVPVDDAQTFALLQRAEVVGVFQLESGGMQNLLLRIKPESLEDIMAVISLYRPGPLGKVDLDDYIARKSGKASKPLLHPALEEVLKDTHGVIIYQEQVMKIANVIAGFTLAEADKLRRVMSKKVPAQMKPMREKFVAGAKARGVTEKMANAVFDFIEPFAHYGFNKSHAAGYGLLAYQTAYLKANHPLEFMAASLTVESGNAEQVRKFVAEVRHMGIELRPPDINYSDFQFTIETLPGTEKRAIRYGLCGIKNLGEGVCEKIIEARADKPFADLRDFLSRTRDFANRKAYESLVMAGVFDGFNPDRAELLEELNQELARGGSARAAMRERQITLFGNNAADEAEARPKPARTRKTSHHSFEKTALGFYLSSHPLDAYRREMEALKCASLANLNDCPPDVALHFAAVIAERKVKKDKRGRDYAILLLEDLSGTAEAMIFSDLLEARGDLFRKDALIFLSGKPRSRNEGQSSVWADYAVALPDVRKWLTGVIIRVHEKTVEDELLPLRVRAILERHPGNADVCFIVRHNDGDRRLRPRDIRVLPSTALAQELEALPEIKAVHIIGRVPPRETKPRYPRYAAEEE